MILYAFESSRRDLSFETHFEFFVFQASVRPSVRSSSVRPCMHPSVHKNFVHIKKITLQELWEPKFLYIDFFKVLNLHNGLYDATSE